MTTTVKVMAHCTDNKEVHVAIKSGDMLVDTAILQDNEAREFIIYDDKKIEVNEQLKGGV